MSKTPRTDAAVNWDTAATFVAQLSRELELALAAANARIAELEAECAELRVDAERYQWLRKQGKPTSPESIWFARGVFGFGGINLWCLDRLDEAIDAAMKKTTI